MSQELQGDFNCNDSVLLLRVWCCEQSLRQR